MQAVWRWLWDSAHKIPIEKRKPLMKLFKNILYADNIIDAENAYKKGCENEEFPQWTKYLCNYWTYKEKWCICFRDSYSRGHVTNNYCEIAVRLYKDHVLGRVKAYNVLALIDLTSTALEDYYKRRLRKFADSRNSSTRLMLQKMMKKVTYLKKDMIVQENYYEFLVPSEQEQTLLYYVNIKCGLCSCSSALAGKFCKHQYAIFQFFNIKSDNFPSITATDLFNIAKIAFGEQVLDKSIYDPFFKIEAIIEQRSETGFNNTNINNDKNDKNVQKLNLIEPMPSSSSESNDSSKFENVLNLLNLCNTSYGSSSTGITKLELRLKKIKSKGQWENCLHAAGNCVPLRNRDGATIKVQPTTIARRSAGVTKGSKRLLAGRPPLGGNTKKRKRNLNQNINCNQPNAKSHGSL